MHPDEHQFDIEQKRTVKKQTPHPQNLGRIVKIYRPRQISWRDFFIYFLPASLAVLTPLIYGYWRGWLAQFQFGPALATQWQSPWFSLSGIALIALLSLGLNRIQNAHRCIQLRQNGLHIFGVRGIQQQISWDEIEDIAAETVQDVFLGIKLGATHRVQIHLKDGSHLKFDARIPGLDDLAARIKAKIYPKRIQTLKSAFQNKETLQFGPVGIDWQQIQLQNQTYRLDQVRAVGLQAGFLMVELHDHTAHRITIGQIPNIELLIQLIREGVGA